ncbi:hypothetical protein OF83DRAFT_1267203 [Amylostereum chailletii]|nr:hypothetical protein OF83DRAFT_1267203 [Amylostereum chailletii]
MTRTERSLSPRALLKDRSEARNGYDSSMRKGGAGAHNWGSLEDEARYEDEAFEDGAAEFAEEGGQRAKAQAQDTETATKPVPVRRVSGATEEEREQALKVRQNALKGNNIDLGSIARSSVAVSGSPPRVEPITNDVN